ncbi:LamG domain-containing protein, partial [Aureibaculum marinum]
MKNTYLKYIGILVASILFVSCQDLERPEFTDFPYDGPVITLLSPSPGGSTIISSIDEIAPVTISFQVEDDLGIATISVDLDGQEILNVNEFSDSKLYSIDNLIQEVNTGSHTLTITATDTNDVVVTETTTFEKIQIPPYSPMFDGEMLYMSFDGNYSEAISGSDATAIGTPGFNTGVIGDAYKGATDSYLTFPSAGLLSDEFSATFWLKIDASDTR